MTAELREQHDDHIWLTVAGEAWAIRGIHWPLIRLWRGYEPELEFCLLDVSDLDFDDYCAKAVAMAEDGKDVGE